MNRFKFHPRIQYRVLSAISLLALGSTGALAYENPQNGLDNGVENVLPIPGHGMLSPYGVALTNNCFSNNAAADNITMGNAKGTINLSSQISQEQMDTMLNIGLGADVSYGPFSASTNADYKKENTSTRYRQSFTYAQTYSATAMYKVPDDYGMNLLNSMGKDAYTAGNFSKVCGDSFIQSAQAGAVLLVTVNLDFKSSSEKNTFTASADAGFKSIASATTSYKKTSETSHVDATMRVTALQQGGDPSELVHLFGTPLENGHSATITCDVKNADTCGNVINKVITYAQNMFSKQAPSEKLYYFAPSFSAYDKYGIAQPKIKVNEKAHAELDYLTTSLEKTRETKAYLDHYYENVVNLYARQINPTTSPKVPLQLSGQVRALQAQYDALVNSYGPALNACFTVGANETCPVFADQIKAKQQALIDQGYAQQAKTLISTIYITGSKKSTNVGAVSSVLISVLADNSMPTFTFPKNGLDFYKGEMNGIAGTYMNNTKVVYDQFRPPMDLYNQFKVKFSGGLIASFPRLWFHSAPSGPPTLIPLAASMDYSRISMFALVQQSTPDGSSMLVPAATYYGIAREFSSPRYGYYLMDDATPFDSFGVSYNPTIKAYDTLAYNPL